MDIKIFVDKRASSQEIEVALNGPGMKLLFLTILLGTRRFAMLLTMMAKVFSVHPSVFHIFWDTQGSTIAFNRNRTIFFNLRFYLGLHYTPPISMPGSFGGESDREDNAQPYIYWFLTSCHEVYKLRLITPSWRIIL
jgi:hypothetical protein